MPIACRHRTGSPIDPAAAPPVLVGNHRHCLAVDTIHPISTDLPTIHLISTGDRGASRRNVDAWIRD
jgi:hypothetical protein